MARITSLVLLPLLMTGCGGAAPQEAKVETVTSEEVRLSDLGQSPQRLTIGRVYRVVGRIRNIEASPDGSPSITFTGLKLIFEKDRELEALKRLRPDDYIEADCKLAGVKSGIFPEMTMCRNLALPTALSAENYEATYAGNVFDADDKLKDRPLVIFGGVRLVSKLNGGEDYVALEAKIGFSDVTAIVAPSARSQIRDYAKVGDLAVMYCRGGFRYNQVGSIGVTDCRFLQNY